MPRILIIVGHPDSHSLCSTLARAYQAGAVQAGHPCELIQLGELSFDPVLHHGYKEIQPLEPCLQTLQDKIQQADHLVFAYPLWWGAMPALLKGFFDRVFLPGFAFRYRDHSVLWDKLLSGKSARVLVTMDTPKWYYRFIYRQPGHQQIRRTILGFCGVRPVRISSFAIVKTSTNKKRRQWSDYCRKLGKEGR